MANKAKKKQKKKAKGDPYFDVNVAFSTPKRKKKCRPASMCVVAKVTVTPQNGYWGMVYMLYDCRYLDFGQPPPEWEENFGNKVINIPKGMTTSRKVDVDITYYRSSPFRFEAGGMDGSLTVPQSDHEDYYP